MRVLASVSLRFAVVVLFCAGLCSVAKAQVTIDREYISRLEYVCKVWGYLKYFHTGIDSTKSWDDSLTQTLSRVKVAQTQAAYLEEVDRLIAGAGAVTTATMPAPVVPQQLRLPVDYSWMNNQQMLSATAIATLLKIQQNFRPFQSYYIEPSLVATPQARNENPYPDMVYPNEQYRLLALFRHWNIINYFFPYKDIIGRAWETVLPEMIPFFLRAQTSNDYYAAVRRMSAQINDSHGFVSQNSMLLNYFGRAVLPIEFRFVQGQTVVFRIPYTRSLIERLGLSDVQSGDVLLSIDGIPIDTLRKRIEPLVPASNNSALNRDINTLLRYGSPGSVSLRFRRGAREFTVTGARGSGIGSEFAADTSQIWRILPNNIGYVDMGRLQRTNIAKMMADLMNTRGIIFDIRNYPNGTLYDIGAYLTQPAPFVRFTYILPSFPGVFARGTSTIPGEITPLSAPNRIGSSKRYQGKIVALINQETQSHAEFTTMAFQAAGAKVIGSQTAGADGNVVTVRLPGDILLYYTSLGVFYPDGKATQRIGIVPDIPSSPTVTGMQAGIDEVLERGIKEILGTPFSNSQCAAELQAVLSPNPMAEKLNIAFTLTGNEKMTIRLYNTLGQCVRETEHNGVVGQNSLTLDVTNLASSLYYCILQSASAACQTALPILKSR